MIQGYSHGGVKMIDMHSYIKALKVTWIRRFLSSNNLGWVTLFLKISNIHDPLALEGGHQALLIYLKGAANQNHFWIDVLNLRWFQFRLVHRILGVNSFLSKIAPSSDLIFAGFQFIRSLDEDLITSYLSSSTDSLV
ncbi:uncharacterized protein [Asterias amurensis]|uniref:uncharacterized protein n=1 Tax=Asterias amurensis TaxID=7602 RepID=UPI003AB88107